MEIIPDPVAAAVLTVPFVVTAAVLWLVLFKPLLAYLDERQAVSARALAEASELRHGAAHRTTEIEKRLAAARESAGAARRLARERAQKREAAILAEARAESDRRVAAAVDALGTERAAASATLRTQAADLARDMTRQILGREIA
jgi:F-type H+-transporting ATPase subunit b